jgi:lipid-A-disaccharide synthase-like uncharacterized protein
MDTITFLYTVSGFIFGAAFIPQIKTLLHDKTGAVSISISTWIMFTLCSMITLLYAFTHNGDGYFIFCTAVCVIGNTCVLTLASFRRLAQKI